MSYELHPDFEAIVLYFTAANKKFWTMAGRYLEADQFASSLAKPIIEAAKLIAKAGQPSSSPLICLQRLQSKVVEGKLAPETLLACGELFDSIEDYGVPDVEIVIQELVPVLRTRMHSKAIEAAHHDYAKGGDMAVSRGLLDQAQKLGHADVVASYSVTDSAFDVIRSSRDVIRLPTGVMELDIAINGGLPRGALGVWLGDPGAGKSQALIHGAGEAMRQQLFAGFITLELPPMTQMARLLANITGVEAELILSNDLWNVEAERRFEMVASILGPCEIAEFSPHATTVADVEEWVDRVEDERGMKMSALYIDYADKMFHGGVKADNEHLMMRYVYEGTRRKLAHDRGMWVWTASQATRPSKDSKKRLDIANVADSMHKVRVADLFVTINRDDETESSSLFVAKNRAGRGRFSVGPLPNDFARGRFVAIARELMQW